MFLCKGPEKETIILLKIYNVMNENILRLRFSTIHTNSKHRQDIFAFLSKYIIKSLGCIIIAMYLSLKFLAIHQYGPIIMKHNYIF